MGNQNSSSAASTSSSSGQRGSKKKQRKALEKSASVGNDLGTSTNTTLNEFQSSILNYEKGLVQKEESSSSSSSTKDKDGSSSTDPEGKLLDDRRQSFHYNIHHPKDLLDCPEKNITSGKGGLLVKRHSSALEFLSSKSPLRGYLEKKFHFHHNNHSGEGDKTMDNHNGDATDKDSVGSSPGSSPAGGKGGSNLEKFAKLMGQLSSGGIEKNGRISEDILQKHLLPHSPLMSSYVWKYLLSKDSSAVNISQKTFLSCTEKIYTLHTDKDQVTFYLRIFGVEKDMVEREAFEEFLISAFQLAKVGSDFHATTLPWRSYEPYQGKDYIEAVVKSCFHIKDDMSICFLTNWLLTNLPRIHVLMHKYILHQLTTGYSQMTTGNATINTVHDGVIIPTGISPGGNRINKVPYLTNPDQLIADLKRIETEKAILEETKANEFRFQQTVDPILLWLLQSSLTPKFLVVFNVKKSAERPLANLHALNSAQLIMQMLHNRPEPETWARLYDSDNDGLSINRFQFHVFNYRGPTLMVITADNGYSFAIASDLEWKESCHFWGGEESTLLQLQPEFRIVEKGVKLLFANFSIRGYPFGIQAGRDPRNVSLEIKPDFSYAHFKQIPCPILKLVVWGCAPKQTQSAQTEYKKWEANQCENLRKVNIKSAEWKDNPDKYLLELAGAYRSYDS